MRWAFEGCLILLKEDLVIVVSKRKNVEKEIILKANLYNLIINS
jgi:hypothetical protein